MVSIVKHAALISLMILVVYSGSESEGESDGKENIYELSPDKYMLYGVDFINLKMS